MYGGQQVRYAASTQGLTSSRVVTTGGVQNYSPTYSGAVATYAAPPSVQASYAQAPMSTTYSAAPSSAYSTYSAAPSSTYSAAPSSAYSTYSAAPSSTYSAAPSSTYSAYQPAVTYAAPRGATLSASASAPVIHHVNSASNGYSPQAYYSSAPQSQVASGYPTRVISSAPQGSPVMRRSVAGGGATQADFAAAEMPHKFFEVVDGMKKQGAWTPHVKPRQSMAARNKSEYMDVESIWD